MDTSLMNTLNDFMFKHDAVEDPLLTYERISQILFVGILVALFFFARRDRRVDARRAAVAAGAATVFALVVGQLISRIVDRPRPFVAHPGSVHLFAPHVADAGFPSDHATAAFAIAVAIMLRDRRWGGVVVGLAVLIAVGRVAMGVHYPSDVLAGALLGSLSALLFWWTPIRNLTDRVADWIGSVVDAALAKLSRGSEDREAAETIHARSS
jgi:undecaprenyl-diphosphatase